MGEQLGKVLRFEPQRALEGQHGSLEQTPQDRDRRRVVVLSLSRDDAGPHAHCQSGASVQQTVGWLVTLAVPFADGIGTAQEPGARGFEHLRGRDHLIDHAEFECRLRIESAPFEKNRQRGLQADHPGQTLSAARTGE